MYAYMNYFFLYMINADTSTSKSLRVGRTNKTNSSLEKQLHRTVPYLQKDEFAGP